MVKKRGHNGASAEAWRPRKKVFSPFTCCSQRSSLCVHGVLDDEGHGVMLLLTLRCLQHYLFAYSSSKFRAS